MATDTSTVLLAAVCLAGAVGYVLATWRAIRPAAVLSKIAASTSFVVLALVCGASHSSYGRVILAALVLSWVGDILLLSRRGTFLLAGIAAFLLAHIAFAAAFAAGGVHVAVFAAALMLTVVFAGVILRWLWGSLSRVYRIAVSVYMGAVIIMVSLAAAASFRSLPVEVVIAAIAFAASDVSVARDRFVERTVANKAWGLPLYYLAQVLFAVSVSPGAR
jgi:uncharacterized membrane protein YhhN